MPSFQTVRLARGRHKSPGHGVCVAELTSMLAGERFSDHPKCACPALTAFVRGYNDRIDDERRQDLYGLAAELVGSRRAEAVTRAREQALLAFAWQHRERIGPVRRFPRLNYADRLMRCEAAGDHLARCARSEPQIHAEVLATLRALIAASGPLATAELQDRGIWSTPAHSTSSTSSRSAITAASAEQLGQRSTQAAPW
jgi:hypothetical protein